MVVHNLQFACITIIFQFTLPPLPVPGGRVVCAARCRTAPIVARQVIMNSHHPDIRSPIRLRCQAAHCAQN